MTDLTVADAVERELARIAKLDKELARGPYAASILALARELDDPENSATSKSMCARSLLDTLDRLRELAPSEEKDDQVDELVNRRRRKLAGGAKAAS
jgi:hypothetical protein